MSRILFLFPCLLAACSGATTQSLLDADFIIAGRSAVKLSSPANGATVGSDVNLVFAWQDIPGVGRYTIEIADTLDFSNIILSKSVTSNEYAFQRADLKSATSFGSNSYFWRVNIASSKNNLRSDVWTVSIFSDNAIYVDCAFTGTGFGSRSAPFKLIQTGLDYALGARGGGNIYFLRSSCGKRNLQ